MNLISPYSYVNVVRHVIQKDGVMGLFGRGLKTRLIANGMQVWSRIQFYFRTHTHPVGVLLGPRETTHQCPWFCAVSEANWSVESTWRAQSQHKNPFRLPSNPVDWAKFTEFSGTYFVRDWHRKTCYDSSDLTRWNVGNHVLSPLEILHGTPGKEE